MVLGISGSVLNMLGWIIPRLKLVTVQHIRGIKAVNLQMLIPENKYACFASLDVSCLSSELQGVCGKPCVSFISSFNSLVSFWRHESKACHYIDEECPEQTL